MPQRYTGLVTPSDDLKVLQLFQNEAAQESAKGLRTFLSYAVMDSRPPNRFLNLVQANPWQDELLDLLIPLVEAACGFRPPVDKPCLYVTAPRGSSKTSLVALLAMWALVYSKFPIKIHCAASDSDQAGIMWERARAECRFNPWLVGPDKSPSLVFEKNKIKGPKGELHIHASDAGSVSGLLGDIFIIDEITWHKKRDLFDVIFSGRNKREAACLIVISNAGIAKTWQHELWEVALADNTAEDGVWTAHEVPAFSASWLSRKQIEADRKVLPPSLFKRLHQNIWVKSNEDNKFLPTRFIKQCFKRDNPSPPNKDHEHVIAVDYGITHDRTALCVCHAERDKIVLDTMERWQGSPENRITVQRIEDWIEDARRKYNVGRVILDVFQLESTAQKLEKQVVVERVNFGGNTTIKLSENLRSLVLNNNLDLYRGAGLLTEGNKTTDLFEEMDSLILVQRPSGYRFDHEDGEHDDGAVVLSMSAYTLFTLSELITARVEIVGGDGDATDYEDFPWGEYAKPF